MSAKTFYVTQGHVVYTQSRKLLKAGQKASKKDFRPLNWKDLLASGQVKSMAQIEEEALASAVASLPQEPEEEETDSVSLPGHKNVLDPEKVLVVATKEGTADPKTPQGPWCEDPESLKDKDLEELQLMVADRDRTGSMDTPPGTREECVTLLTRNFQPETSTAS